MVERALAMVVSGVEVVIDAGTATHRPVDMTLPRGVREIWVRVERKSPARPPDLLPGPRRRDVDWSKAAGARSQANSTS